VAVDGIEQCRNREGGSPQMTFIEIELDDGRTSFRPGEELAGSVLWDLSEGESVQSAPDSAEVRLVWFTRGRGDRDSGIVAAEELAGPQAVDRRRFRFTLPAGPYSVSGKLVSIVWAVEVVLEPGSRAARTEIVVSPTGREILLHSDQAAEVGEVAEAGESGKVGEELAEGEFWGPGTT